LLALGALAVGRAVVVSRGEQIEIGGGFRIPEVLARSGARMIEVGTTNRTRLADYERALAAQGDAVAVLRVHPGNFKQSGFVERPTLEALAGVAHRRGVWLIEDLGGGALVDLAAAGLSGEPTVQSSVAAGADLVCFSCDKLLGGPQAGALCGKAELVERARRDPLARALRLGRLALVALEETLALYLSGDLDAIPTLRALRLPLDAVRQRVEGWCRQLAEHGVRARPLAVLAAAGGGALAEVPLASVAAVVETEDAEALGARLRAGAVAVLGRIHDGQLLLDGRTVLPDEDAALLEAVVAAVR
jgi:L-seryl-tRNA(Ser) seleniumtransferase